MNRDLLSGLWVARQPPQLAPREWEVLLAQARAARLLARLAHHYENRGWLTAVPEAPRRHLECAMRLADRLRHEVLSELDQIAIALRDVPTPVVVLKGAAYLAARLAPAQGRVFSDVDILVRREQLPAVEAALFSAGWIAEKLKPYDDRYYRQWMHELPPLQHIQRRTYLDVHHTITPPTSCFAIEGRVLLARREPLADEPHLSLLAPVDMVLHSVVHLMQEGDFGGGLRDLLDLNDLLGQFGGTADFWTQLARRARELSVGVPLHHALGQVERLFGTQAPHEARSDLAALAPTGIGGRLMPMLLEAALRPDHPSCDRPLTALKRWMLYVRSHWLRMPWYQIAPHLLRKAWARIVERYAAASSIKAQAGNP